MFNFIKRHVAPGESCVDSHHLGFQIWNPGETAAQVQIRIEDVAVQLDFALPPNGFITESDEQSRHAVVIENRGENELVVEFKKSRD